MKTSSILTLRSPEKGALNSSEAFGGKFTKKVTSELGLENEEDLCSWRTFYVQGMDSWEIGRMVSCLGWLGYPRLVGDKG